MRKSKLLIALTLTLSFVIMTCIPVFALSLKDLPEGSSVPDQNININAGLDGSFKNLTYVISSTGATSGIRYRTSAITLNIGGQMATIDISALVGHSPSGTQLYSQITVTMQDILKALPNPNSSDVIQALNNPESIQIGANIQIYNAGTGKVLATITNKNDVASVAGAIGFGSQDISDMESRFLGDGRPPVVIDNKDKNGDDSGVRPSILVK